MNDDSGPRPDPPATGTPRKDDPAAAAAAACSPAGRRWTLVAAIVGSSMAFVDGTVVNVALPAIQRALDASASGAQWVIESYALFLAALLLAGGALGDRFGRRSVFMLGAAIFTAASLACGLSMSVAQLVASRAVQGVGAALLVPGSLSLLSAAYPEAERGRAIGTWSAFSGITAAIGPLVGGWLVEHRAWNWAFLVNLPLGGLLLAICVAKVPKGLDVASDEPVDWLGAALATAGLAGLVYALIAVPAAGWSAAEVWGPALGGVVLLAVFVRVETRARSPMLPLALFRNRAFAGANLLTLLLYAALGGALFFLPLDLIQVQGFGATAAGAALLPFVAIMFALSRWAGRLVDLFGARLPLVVGPAIAAAGFAAFALPGVGGGYWSGFFPAVCVLGLGMSVTIAPLTTTVMNSAGSDHAGVASGINNAVSRAAGLLAIAGFGIVLAAAFDARLAAELPRLRLPPDVAHAVLAQRGRLAGMTLPGGLPDVIRQALHDAIGRAFVAGFRRVMLVGAALALLSAVAAWFLIPGRAAAAPGRAAPR